MMYSEEIAHMSVNVITPCDHVRWGIKSIYYRVSAHSAGQTVTCVSRSHELMSFTDMFNPL